MKEGGAKDSRMREAADRAEEAFIDFRQLSWKQELLSKASGHYSCGEEALSLLEPTRSFPDEEAADIEKLAVGRSRKMKVNSKLMPEISVRPIGKKR